MDSISFKVQTPGAFKSKNRPKSGEMARKVSPTKYEDLTIEKQLTLNQHEGQRAPDTKRTTPFSHNQNISTKHTYSTLSKIKPLKVESRTLHSSSIRPDTLN